MNKKSNKKFFKNWIPAVMLSVSGLGFACFYLFPFFVSFGYVLMENPLTREFAGLKNFISLFQYPYFLLGLKNTLLFLLLALPGNMAASLGIALTLRRFRRYRPVFSLIFLIPLVIPSATAAAFWEMAFGRYGFLNKILGQFGIAGPDWLQSEGALFAVLIIFLWKNIGYNMALFVSGLANIPEQYYECAALEGAGRSWKFFKITLVYLTPTLFLVLVMTIVNSFKVFKEVYVITGQYPPAQLYLLQHYMNNMFLSLQYPKLATATYVLTAAITLLLVFLFRAERKYADRIR